MKPIGTTWVLFALCALLQNLPVLCRNGNVRGLQERLSHRHGGAVDFVRSYRMLKKMNGEKDDDRQDMDSFEEELALIEASSEDYLDAQESSGDPLFVPGDMDSIDATDPPNGTPEVIMVNVSITYFLANSTGQEEEAVMAAESVSVLRQGPQGRRRTQEEVTPTELEIDTLINNTINFYTEVYMNAFGDTLLSLVPTSVVTQDVSPGVFFLNYEALLVFSSAPPTEEVAAATVDIDEREYIEVYVWPSGPYFGATESIDIVPVATGAQSTQDPTQAETEAPTPGATATPTMAPTLEATTATPTSSPTEMPTMATAAPTVEDILTVAPTEGEPLVETTEPTSGDVVETAEPTVGEVVETAEPTANLSTEAPTEGEPIETAEPTQGVATAASTTVEPTAGPETLPPTEAPTTAEPTEGQETSPPTAAPTDAEVTLSPVAPETIAPTPCPGRSTRVSGTILLALDPEQDLSEPIEGQIVEVAQHVLQAFGVVLRDAYDAAVRGFSATIDETSTELDGNAYPLGFEANILFSPCSPPPEDINAVFESANYTAILENFVPTGEDNVFQYLTGEATYNGEAEIEF